MNHNLKFRRGQEFYGVGKMKGEKTGCAARIMAKYPGALYVHCASHSLNLAVGDICSIPNFRNCISIINEVIKLFPLSPKRQDALNKAVNEIKNEVKKKCLMKFRATRWVENMESILQFEDFFLPIFSTLEDIEMTGNTESSKDAYAYQQSVRDGKFIVAMSSTRFLHFLNLSLVICKQ